MIIITHRLLTKFFLPWHSLNFTILFISLGVIGFVLYNVCHILPNICSMVFENLSIFGIFREGLVAMQYSLPIHVQNTVWVQLKRISKISLFLLSVIRIRLAENQWRLKDYWIHSNIEDWEDLFCLHLPYWKKLFLSNIGLLKCIIAVFTTFVSYLILYIQISY